MTEELLGVRERCIGNRGFRNDGEPEHDHGHQPCCRAALNCENAVVLPSSVT
jgi:hypothetical protein